MFKKILGIALALMLFAAPVFGFDSWNKYPEDFDTVCYTEIIPGYHYVFWHVYDTSEIPDEIPPEGWEAPLLWEAYCQNPNGAFEAYLTDMGLLVIRENLVI